MHRVTIGDMTWCIGMHPTWFGERDFDIRTLGFIRHSSLDIRPYSVFKYSNTARRCSSLSFAGKLCPDALLPGRRVSK